MNESTISTVKNQLTCTVLPPPNASVQTGMSAALMCDSVAASDVFVLTGHQTSGGSLNVELLDSGSGPGQCVYMQIESLYKS